MFATIKGHTVSIQLNEPGKKDSFSAHQLISVLQINEKGDAEIIKIKDENLQRKWEKNKEFNQFCNIMFWQNSGKSGISVKVLG